MGERALLSFIHIKTHTRYPPGGCRGQRAPPAVDAKHSNVIHPALLSVLVMSVSKSGHRPSTSVSLSLNTTHNDAELTCLLGRVTIDNKGVINYVKTDD